jgi:hypothetical protein
LRCCHYKFLINLSAFLGEFSIFLEAAQQLCKAIRQDDPAAGQKKNQRRSDLKYLIAHRRLEKNGVYHYCKIKEH